MSSGTNVKESIKSLIRAGYVFTVDNKNIRYKFMQVHNPELVDTVALTKDLMAIKQNKPLSITYLKSLVTIKAVLTAIMPTGHILLIIDIFNYKKETEQEIIEIFETTNALNDYMDKNYFCCDNYEPIHSINEPGVFYLKVSDRKKYMNVVGCYSANFRELTPEESADCPW